MRQRTTANMCEIKKYIIDIYYIFLNFAQVSNMYFLISHIFAVVFRRIAVFLLSNLFTNYHCKDPRIRRATLVSCPFLFRFIFSHNFLLEKLIQSKAFIFFNTALYLWYMAKN